MKAPTQRKRLAAQTGGRLDIYAANIRAIEQLREALEKVGGSPAQANSATIFLLGQMARDMHPKPGEQDEDARFLSSHLMGMLLAEILQYFADKADFRKWLDLRRQRVEKLYGPTIEQRAADARKDRALQRLITSAINSPSLGDPL